MSEAIEVLSRPNTKATLSLIEQSLDKDKAEDIVVIDLNGKSEIADYMVIASGRSNRHINSMADHLQFLLKAQGLSHVSVEGIPDSEWVLIDTGDVIVHIFPPELRQYYNLEKLWRFEPKSRKTQKNI